ncbi:MAG: hypothetical protein WA921_05685 [Ahrensia sp.]
MMYDDDEWNAIQPKSDYPSAFANRALRSAALFGISAIALTMIILPLVSSEGSRQLAGINPGIDPVTTATVRQKDRVYTMRQSVLQKRPTDVCVIRENGTFEGQC